MPDNKGSKTPGSNEVRQKEGVAPQPALLFGAEDRKGKKSKVEDRHVSLLLKPDLYQKLQAQQKAQGARSFNSFVTRLFELYCDGKLVIKE